MINRKMVLYSIQIDPLHTENEKQMNTIPYQNLTFSHLVLPIYFFVIAFRSSNVFFFHSTRSFLSYILFHFRNSYPDMNTIQFWPLRLNVLFTYAYICVPWVMSSASERAFVFGINCVNKNKQKNEKKQRRRIKAKNEWKLSRMVNEWRMISGCHL